MNNRIKFVVLRHIRNGFYTNRWATAKLDFWNKYNAHQTTNRIELKITYQESKRS